MDFNTISAPVNLRDMNQVMQTWLNEKPSGNFGDPNELRIQTGDAVLLQFVANGDDGDKFIKIYRSHVEGRVTSTGKRFNQTRYCPIQTQERDVPCDWCAAGKDVVKERMSMWFYVLHHFHAVMPKDKQFPGVNYQGKNYYDEEVNAFKVWHSSAWKDSPWQAILKLYEIYHGLHNFTGQLEMTGSGTATRYSVIALPNTPALSPELYERAKTECEPILDILHKELTVTPTQANPQQPQTIQQQQAPSNDNIAFTPFAAPGSSMPVFSVPTVGLSTNTEPAPTMPTLTPVEPSPQAENRPEEQPVAVTSEATPVRQEEPEERPTKSLF